MQPEIQDSEFQTEFREVARDAVHTLHQIMHNGYADKNAQAQARVASMVISAWSRYLQGERIQAATAFSMARELARNPDEFRHFLRVAMPDNPMVRAIPVPALAAVNGS